MIYQTPRQSGKVISQKLYAISNKLAQRNSITLWKAWHITKDYWRDNYGKELTYELVEKGYRKKQIMNNVGMGSLNLNLDREELENLEKEINEK